MLYAFHYDDNCTNISLGLEKKHSTTLALIEIIDGIKHHIDKGEAVIGTYLDLKKAFDTVNHGILCAKL